MFVKTVNFGPHRGKKMTRSERVKEISKRCGISRASVYRCLKKEKTTLKKKSPGRPRKITLGDQRIINRNKKRF